MKKSSLRKDTRELVLEVFAGNVVFNLILLTAAFIFYRQPSVYVGLAVGMAAVGGMLLHMAYLTDKALDEGEPDRAQKILMSGSILRKAVYIILFLILLVKFPRQVNPFAVLIGVMGMKAGVYMQPWFRKILRHEPETV